MGDFVTEAFTLLAIALVVIGLRTYARSTSAGIRNFQIDDYLMLVAGVSEPLSFGGAPSIAPDVMLSRSYIHWRRQRRIRLEPSSMVWPTIA